MSEADNDRAERHGRILAELAEVGVKAVRNLSEALEEAKTVVDKERVALSLHRMSRDLRLTIALEERLVHERRQAFREERTDRAKAVEHRKKQVDHAVTERVYAEREGEDAEALLERLDGLLDEHRLYEAFLDAPLEAVIEELCQRLGLPDPPPGRSPIEGEVDRALGRETEGVEGRGGGSGLQPPHRPSAGAPPEGEQLGALSLKLVPT